MEQKKILWILFAVTLFFLVVVGAGFIWFYPGAQQPQEQQAAVDGPGVGPEETTPKLTETQAVEEEQDFDPIEWMRSSENYPGLREPQESAGEKKEQEESFIVVYGQDDSGEDSEQEPPVAPQQQEKDSAKEERPSTDPAPQESVSDSQTAAKEVPEKKKREETTQEQKRYEGTEKTIRTVEYWIQTGSYTSKSRAEQVRDELEKKGFTSRITVKDVEGEQYFRVRIGPYKHEQEAEKFLKWVKEIEKFEKSYVSQVYSEKKVAD